MRLIDVDKLWDSIKKDVAPFNVAMISRHIHSAPTIDPETLPIVQELKEQLAKVTAERDAAIEDLKLSRLCETCKFNDEDFDLPFVNCLSPEVCELGNKWQWRRLEESEND